MSKVLIIDTSVYCCWLKVPGKDTAGSDDDKWNFARANKIILDEMKAGAYLVLPLATLLETGNHIAQSSSLRFECAKLLAEHVTLAANATLPWIAFTEQSDLWNQDNLVKLASEWPALAAQNISIGDATIKNVADFYSSAHFDVVILTGDAGLKAYEPARPKLVPRRRR